MSRALIHSRPANILMVKGHSAGIGDLLRSSAAWRALHDHFPGARLHLLFLTKDPGYVSEGLIARHHLLASCRVLDKRTHGWRGYSWFLGQALQLARSLQPELIIDFESGGMRTSLVTRCLGWQARALTVGIAQVPLRRLFYSRVAKSVARYALQRNLPLPLEYTCRDFVVLAALGIERNGRPIELAETVEATRFRLALRSRFHLPAEARLLGLNVGCGTSDAVGKRPNLEMLSQVAAALQTKYRFHLVLTGAPFEADVNRQFSQLHRHKHPAPILDLAGHTTLIELVGAINACELFISSDSGPYHMAVALRRPTLAVFPFANRLSYHDHPWVRCLVADDIKASPALLQVAEELLATNDSPHPSPQPGDPAGTVL